MPWIEATASALAYSFAREHAPDGEDPLSPPPNDAARFIAFEVSRMPDFLRPPMRALTRLFDLAGILHGGTLFHRLRPDARARQIRAWRNSRFAACRDLMRFYEGLTVFAIHSR